MSARFNYPFAIWEIGRFGNRSKNHVHFICGEYLYGLFNGTVGDVSNQTAGLKFPEIFLGWAVWRKKFDMRDLESPPVSKSWEVVYQICASTPMVYTWMGGISITNILSFIVMISQCPNLLMTTGCLIWMSIIARLVTMIRFLAGDLLPRREIKEWGLRGRLGKLFLAIFRQLVFQKKM